VQPTEAKKLARLPCAREALINDLRGGQLASARRS
jgi:hypothetical protein